MKANSVTNRSAGQLSAVQEGLTPQQKILRGTALAVVAIAVVFFATKLYNSWNLSYITDIPCTEDSAYYKAGADNGDANARYCLAGMYKAGKGVEKSLEKARILYEAALNQGLGLAKQELCDHVLYGDWSPQQRANANSGPLADICCPGRSTCPWWPASPYHDIL